MRIVPCFQPSYMHVTPSPPPRLGFSIAIISHSISQHVISFGPTKPNHACNNFITFERLSLLFVAFDSTMTIYQFL